MAGAAVEEKPPVEAKAGTVRLWSTYPSLTIRNLVKPEFHKVVNEHGHEERSVTRQEVHLTFHQGIADVDPKYLPVLKRADGFDRDFWLLDELKMMYKNPKTRATAKGCCKERYRVMALAAEKGREDLVPKELDMIMEIAGQ